MVIKVCGLLVVRETKLKCAFRQMGSQAVVPCGTYDVACMSENPFCTIKMSWHPPSYLSLEVGK